MSKLVGIITAAALVMVLLGTFAYGASNALADSPPDWSGRSGCTTEESAVQPYLADSNGNMTSTADGDALTFKLTICPATEDEHDNYSSVNAGASAACNCNYNQGVVF